MSPDHRRSLPLIANHPTGRAAVTCRYRCGNACAHDAPNTSDNEYLGDVIASALSRRGVLRAGVVLAAGAGAAVALPGLVSAQPASPNGRGNGHAVGHEPPGTRFTPVAPNTRDEVVVPPGYRQDILVRWGDPLFPDAPEFDFAAQNEERQAQQFGYNNDFCGLVPLDRDRWLMVSNHEYTSEPFMWRRYDEAAPTERQVRTAWAAHGMSVVVVERTRGGGLRMVKDRRYNRRVTVSSEFEVRGPAAGSPHLRTSADPTGRRVLGTLNNCAGGVTPWGTILSGEENFHQYFGRVNDVTDPVAKARLARYGVVDQVSERSWELFDRRFDLVQEPNEINRFGWIVELDPLAPDEPPVKHTALGRFKHEGANVHVARDGRVVAYMGDDERFDYLYKFVSDGRLRRGASRAARAHNKRLLDSGTLYVAKLSGDSPASEISGAGLLPSDGEFDGSGRWIALAHNGTSFVPGMTADEVYVFTRLAADKAGATKMDRPEDVEPSPHNGRIYAALTNNTRRGTGTNPGVDEANPRPANRHGHVLELEEDGGDHTGTTFTWRLLLVCGDPNSPDTYFAGFDKTQVSPISCPDNVAFDSHGNLWISTDGNALGSNDGLFSVPLSGPHRGHVKQFLTVPRGAETCGPVITDDFVLVSVQHPGEVDGASADNPVSAWPDGPGTQPRPAVVVVYPARR